MVYEHQAELIFVKGPQTGERVVLLNPVTLCGRSMDAGVHIQEQTVSREQLVFELLDTDWSAQNLSKTIKMVINGKKYKAGKKVLLDSGDIFELGLETAILFVAPGSDPDEVLAAYRAEHPSEPVPVQPFALGITPSEGVSSADPGEMPATPSISAPAPAPVPVALPPEPPVPSAQPGWLTEPAPQVPPVPEKPSDGEGAQSQTPTEDPVLDARRAKIKKYLIIGGIYLLLIICAGIGLYLFKSDKKPPRVVDSMVKPKRSSIRRVLTSELKRSADPVRANECIGLARQYYRMRDTSMDLRYLCVLHFRLFLAHSPGMVLSPEDERQYETVRQELVEKIYTQCVDVFASKYSSNWEKAREQIGLILEMVPPDACRDDPETLKMVQCFLDWTSYVGAKIAENRKD